MVFGFQGFLPKSSEDQQKLKQTKRLLGFASFWPSKVTTNSSPNLVSKPKLDSKTKGSPLFFENPQLWGYKNRKYLILLRNPGDYQLRLVGYPAIYGVSLVSLDPLDNFGICLTPLLELFKVVCPLNSHVLYDLYGIDSSGSPIPRLPKAYHFF